MQTFERQADKLESRSRDQWNSGATLWAACLGMAWRTFHEPVQVQRCLGFPLFKPRSRVTIAALIMDPLIELLRNNSNRTPKEIALALGISEADVAAQIAAAEADGTILGYSAVVDRLKAGDRRVTALIEVRISPERDGGFDRLARRISKFDQVRDCYLMSGGYDLAVIVEGKDLLDVATFVAEKLSTLGGVLSTATRFQLKAYKENGFLSNGGGDEDRLLVAP